MVVAERVQPRSLREPGIGQASRPHAPVLRVRLDDREAGPLERSQEAAQIAGVQIELGSEDANVGSVETDLPKQPGFTQWPGARHEAVVQRADSLRDGAVEPPHVNDPGLLDYPTFISDHQRQI